MRDFLTNPIMAKVHDAWRADLIRVFPVLADLGHDQFLWLYKYLARAPSKFYSRPMFQLFHAWLDGRDQTHRTDLQNYLAERTNSISRALARLDVINSSDWHDDLLSSNDDEKIRFVDQEVNPAYLNLVEGVLVPLIRVAAYCSRLDRGKGVEGLDAFNIVEELRNTTLTDVCTSYDHTVRNAIAHGMVTYHGFEIEYRDRHAVTALSCREVVDMCDDMLDACNAIALAWSIFTLSRRDAGYSAPQQCLFEELRERSRTPWWDIVAVIPVKRGDVRQLNLYTIARTRDRLKVQGSAFQTGLSAGLLAPDFDRYFVSIRSPHSLPGWAAFKGPDVQRFLSNSSPGPDDLLGVAEDNLIFFTPRNFLPRLLWRIHTFWEVLRAHWPLYVSQSLKSRGLPRIEIRDVSIHRDGWQCVVRGQAYLDNTHGEITQELIRRCRRRIIRRLVTVGKRTTSRFDLMRLLPLGFAYVSVFRSDQRKRRLINYGLGTELVCTIRRSRIPRIQSPDISGAEVEVQGKHRIAWNRSWLDSTP